MYGRLIGGEYRVGKPLGKGGFGTTYRGLHVATRTPVAIKVEHAHLKQSALDHERLLYEQLHPCPGLPAIEWHGTVDGRRVLVMELLGCSLEKMRQQLPEQRVPLVTVLEMGQQLLRLLQRLHEKRVVHRDIKPDNVVLGRAHHRDRLFVVDLGLARHAAAANPRARKKLAGSARYCSVHTHDGLAQTYRDDLEGLAYTLLHLLHGKLPWQGLKDDDGKGEEEALSSRAAKAAKIAKYKVIGEAKRALQPAHVQPAALRQLLLTARTLQHGEMPPYDKLLVLFHAPPPDGLVCHPLPPWTPSLPPKRASGSAPFAKPKPPPSAPPSCAST